MSSTVAGVVNTIRPSHSLSPPRTIVRSRSIVLLGGIGMPVKRLTVGGVMLTGVAWLAGVALSADVPGVALLAGVAFAGAALVAGVALLAGTALLAGLGAGLL